LNKREYIYKERTRLEAIKALAKDIKKNQINGKKAIRAI